MAAAARKRKADNVQTQNQKKAKKEATEQNQTQPATANQSQIPAEDLTVEQTEQCVQQGTSQFRSLEREVVNTFGSSTLDDCQLHSGDCTGHLKVKQEKLDDGYAECSRNYHECPFIESEDKLKSKCSSRNVLVKLERIEASEDTGGDSVDDILLNIQKQCATIQTQNEKSAENLAKPISENKVFGESNSQSPKILAERESWQLNSAWSVECEVPGIKLETENDFVEEVNNVKSEEWQKDFNTRIKPNEEDIKEIHDIRSRDNRIWQKDISTPAEPKDRHIKAVQNTGHGDSEEWQKDFSAALVAKPRHRPAETANEEKCNCDLKNEAKGIEVKVEPRGSDTSDSDTDSADTQHSELQISEVHSMSDTDSRTTEESHLRISEVYSVGLQRASLHAVPGHPDLAHTALRGCQFETTVAFASASFSRVGKDAEVKKTVSEKVGELKKLPIKNSSDILLDDDLTNDSSYSVNSTGSTSSFEDASAFEGGMTDRFRKGKFSTCAYGRTRKWA